MNGRIKIVLGSTVLLLGILGTSNDLKRRTESAAHVSAESVSEEKPIFIRTGPQRHLLVLASANSAAVKKARHQLQQVAVNRRWFLFHLSLNDRGQSLSATTLSEFDQVVLNQLRRDQLAPDQIEALDAFERTGGKITAVFGNLKHPDMEPR